MAFAWRHSGSIRMTATPKRGTPIASTKNAVTARGAVAGGDGCRDPRRQIGRDRRARVVADERRLVRDEPAHPVAEPRGGLERQRGAGGRPEQDGPAACGVDQRGDVLDLPAGIGRSPGACPRCRRARVGRS